MDQPTMEQLRHTVRASRAGLVSFWLSVAAALMWAGGVTMGLGNLLHEGHVDSRLWAWSMVLHLVAAILAGVGSGCARGDAGQAAADGVTMARPVLNGPLLVLSCVLLLVFGIDLIYRFILT